MIKKLFNDLNLFKRSSKDLIENKEISSKEDFLIACSLVKNQRTTYELSINQLAIKTKISSRVIEAIENGDINNLPERTFLKQMLVKIEMELGLYKDSLLAILQQSKDKYKTKEMKIITLNKIDFFSSWESNIIYTILMLLSILALNRQQYYLSNMNTITVSPITNPQESEDINDDIHLKVTNPKKEIKVEKKNENQ